MAIIQCPGSFPPAEDQWERSLFLKHIPLLLDKTDQILEQPILYFCAPSCCWTSLAYIAGGRLCLGYLVEGWQEGVFVDTCPQCSANFFVFQFSGSILNGSNSSGGYCCSCWEEKRLKNSRRFRDWVTYLHWLRRQKPINAKEWVEVTGSEFSFEDAGLKPAMRKELVTRPAEPDALSLREVIEALEQ